MEILSYGGFPLDGSEGITAVLQARGGSGAIDVSPQVRSVAESVGRLVGRAIEPRTLLLRVQPVGNLRADPLRAVVARAFPLGEGLKPLVAQRPDTTVVQILAEVLSVDLSPDDSPFLRPVVRLLCPDPFWQAVAESTSPGPTVIASGNVPARARIVVPGTSGATCTRRRYAVTDRCGRGVGGYPLMLSDTWPASAQNTVVFQNGLMVPFRVASGKLWTRVDLPPNGTTYVDVYSGSGIQNTVTADALDDGGLDLAASTNTSWRWYAIRAGRNPLAATGAWRFGRTFAHPQERDYNFGVLVDSETMARLAAADSVMPESAHLIDDYDSVVCVTGVEIVSVSVHAAARARSYTEIRKSREYMQEVSGQAEFTDEQVRSRTEIENYRGTGHTMLFVRQGNSPTWRSVASTYVSGWKEWEGLFSVSFSSDRPVALALRCQPGTTHRRGGSTVSTVDPTGDVTTITNWLTTGIVTDLLLPIEVTLASGKVPLVTLVETVTARIRTGTIRNATTGQWIELEEVYTDAVDLVLDGEARQVSVASGPLYAREIRFSDAPRWIELEPGANAVSAPWPVEWRWRDRWLV